VSFVKEILIELEKGRTETIYTYQHGDSVGCIDAWMLANLLSSDFFSFQILELGNGNW